MRNRDKTSLLFVLTLVICAAALGADSPTLVDQAEAGARLLKKIVEYPYPFWVEGLVGWLVAELGVRVKKTRRAVSLFYLLRDFFVYAGIISQAIGRFLDRAGVQRAEDKSEIKPPPQV